ncbi:MAG: molecular chaperone [Acidimicrobiales bacterium]|jgi:TorA maturation chaperone TorD
MSRRVSAVNGHPPVGVAEAVADAKPEAEPGSEPPETATIVAAVDLLSHLWSRPVAGEVQIWVDVTPVEAETHRRISSNPSRLPIRRPVDVDEALELLDEHERLFVGPGQVPCPPYESFWREDVPVDIRRTLMGPCTADLRQLYLELGLDLSSEGSELPDHVAVEFEALAYALSFEETAVVARRLLEHLGHWLPRLCRAVAIETEHEFYRDLAAVTLDWLVAAKRYFAVVDSG